MKDKIEVNEYVRTKDGIIAQIKSIDYENKIYEFDRIIYTNVFGFSSTSLDNDEMFQKIIVKHSKQLIDLIEIDDIVNGYRVLDIKKIVKDIEPFKIIYSKKEISICVLSISEAGTYYIDIRDTDIETILTKESYMANCYKVGGEDEC